MVLILSARNDACAVRLSEELRHRHVPVWQLADDEVLRRLGVGWRPGSPSESFLEVDSCRAGLKDVRGVLVRSFEALAADPRMSPKDQRFAAFEMQAVLLGMLNELPGRVVNRPVPGQTFRPAFRVRENLRHITSAGFRIPETLVTTSVEHAEDTFVNWGTTCWASWITGEPPVVLQPGAEGEARLRDEFAERTACLIRQPDGQGLEAVIVGDQVNLGTRAASWTGRFNAGQIRSTEVEEDLRDCCIALGRSLGLLFARFSLQRDRAGGVYVMDIDTYPDPSACEADMEKAIICQLADIVGGS